MEFHPQDSSSYLMIKKMSAENEKQIELTENLLKNNVIPDKVSRLNKNQLDVVHALLLLNTIVIYFLTQFNPDSIISKSQPLAEEIEKTVLELLKENAKLKGELFILIRGIINQNYWEIILRISTSSLIETLQRTNTSMKDQLTTFTKLQEEVLKIHQSHQHKFEETKDLVLKVIAVKNLLPS